MANANTLRPSIGRLATRVTITPTRAVTAQFLSSTAAPFSTSTAQCKRKTRDNNRLRGVSALRRTGPREPLSVSWDELPKPVDFKPRIDTDADHGLWGFFSAEGKLMNQPKEDEAHGRAWTVKELREKGWEDLHALWWSCCRERNRIATPTRSASAPQTMQGIKHVLTERYYLWEDARELAKTDPEIDLSGNGEAYQPSYERGEDHLVAEPSEATLEDATRKTDAAASTANVEGVHVDPSTLPAGDKAPVQSQKL
ncbi:50S ribosomal protein L4 [Verticillium alfalfae VaMs.102]|uniref:Large ribosomal subunit protein uL29m n=1 Tax=Verticillium alfalfae (strain VaMs.102 / ATCC MYA-4576 / FGSC 10136) TaxID=526221 RepID=C9SJA6_VERA1|nr:50S ribosomal protein L4 [Verticillium alfalfae VaMs.102]EEY18268.1 50S ribosomal protein L4 [Verticillium alfalfae VaMs.102]